MRIDSHHAFSARYPLEHLESILNRNRFDASILVLPLQRALVGQPSSAAAGLPLGVPAFVKGVIAPLGHADHPKLVGQIHDFADGDLPELKTQHLPLDVLHGLYRIPEISDRYPDLRIAIVHLGYPPTDDWPQAMERAARLPQVVCKLSGLTRFPDPRPYVRHALALFGPHRLMFGSDWPNSLPEHTWKANLSAFTQAIGAQPIEVREELLGGVAARFYAL